MPLVKTFLIVAILLFGTSARLYFVYNLFVPHSKTPAVVSQVVTLRAATPFSDTNLRFQELLKAKRRSRFEFSFHVVETPSLQFSSPDIRSIYLISEQKVFSLTEDPPQPRPC